MEDLPPYPTPRPPPYPLLLVCLIRLSIRHNYLIVLHQIILAVFDLTNNWPYSIVGLKTVIKNSITFPDFHCNNDTVLLSTGWTRVGYKLATASQGSLLVTLLATVGYNWVSKSLIYIASYLYMFFRNNKIHIIQNESFQDYSL